jgi:hypothetical protein
MLESQEIPGVTPIQQKKALEADSIPHEPAFRGKSVSQSDSSNKFRLIVSLHSRAGTFVSLVRYRQRIAGQQEECLSYPTLHA